MHNINLLKQSLSVDYDDVLIVKMIFAFAPLRSIAEAHRSRAPTWLCMAVTKDCRQIVLGASESCPAAHQPFPSISSYSRPPDATVRLGETVACIRESVSSTVAVQCVDGAIGKEYPQVKQLQAITQVPMTPVSTYR